MHILIVDDEKNIRTSIKEFFSLEGITSAEAENGLSAQKLLQEEVYDGVIMDLRMPGLTGLELLTWLKKEGPNVPVVMISAFGDVEDAVHAMKLGAADYLVKPFDPEELLLRINQAVERNRLKRQSDLHTEQEHLLSAEGTYNPLQSGNNAMIEIERLVEKVAPTDSTVLITGESGTGKEVVAKRLHQLSKRKDNPFIPINLGGIPDTLLESELFGYEKGAFTGAERRKAGMFEMASSGTLFLDEIGEMPVQLQVKLLRVLQERKLQRLGGVGSIPIDVRIIAATNKNLEEQVKLKQFREDLFYRLNVINIELPPLRERTEDIPHLAVRFVKDISQRTGKTVRGITEEALTVLTTYSFPGNIRELENIIERAVILCDEEELSEKDFPLQQAGAGPPKSVKSGSLRELEREAIVNALLRHEGRRQAAADELGITRRTLLNKIKEYSIEAKEKT